ncbi:hypothetical protein [Pyrobaculum ferrireducens]|uniref:hypothetical protein n=1 Tax=Pyrobaculum ferrireducens TaxID=1104324 RepID=UPI0011E58334|nr:hypothetical protein [Pyrobaculum ferrireducens]
MDDAVVEVLNRYDHVVVDPTNVDWGFLSRIRAVKVSYLDLGEYVAMELGDCAVGRGVFVGYDQLWGRHVVNASSPEWVEYIKCQVRHVMEMGV